MTEPTCPRCHGTRTIRYDGFIGPCPVCREAKPGAISFVVFGVPQQVGSKTSFVPLDKSGNPYRRVNGGGVMVQTTDSNKKAKPWMAAVRAAAGTAFHGDLITGPVRLTITFFFPRPQSHFGTGKNAGKVKASAPHRHAGTPDIDKLCRAIADGLTGVVLKDDKQVAELAACKLWTAQQARAEVTIEPLEDAATQLERLFAVEEKPF